MEQQWANYFVATASAAAALTGLIFVSVSINLQRILSIKQLPNRAMGSLMLLTNILIVSSLCLVPGRSAIYLGIEIALLSIAIWFIFTRMDVKAYRDTEKQYKKYILQNLVFAQVAIIPYIACGVCLLTGNANIGIYCLVPGITLSFIKALLDAWVLLIEIHR